MGMPGATTDAWSPSISNTRTEAMARAAGEDLVRYLSFDSGWDGYDGLTFNIETVTKARVIIQRAVEGLLGCGLVPSEITPGPASDGSVDVEIVVSQRTLIFTLDRDDTTTVRVYASSGDQVTEREDTLEDGGLGRWLGWLTRKNGIPPVLGASPRHPRPRSPLALCL
jgi:hypothetical protein